MDTRPLGSTGLTTSPIGLGLAALGRPGYINLGHAVDLEHDYAVESMERRAFDVLDAAWQAGCRYFDAARSYGRAEEFLSHWLAARNVPPGAVTVGSKWGYAYTANWRVIAEHHEVKEHSLAQFTRQWHESQALLGTHVGLYQIHSATLESGVLDDVAVCRALTRLHDQGIVVGLTLSGPRQADTLRRAMELRIDGVPVFSCVQATWNLLERSAGAALDAAHAAGWGVIIKEALANGRLTERNREPGFAEQRRALAAVAGRLGGSFDAVALAGVLSRPWIDVVLSGASTIEQLRSNLRALDLRFDDDAEAALAELAEPAEAYWKTRSALPWN